MTLLLSLVALEGGLLLLLVLFLAIYEISTRHPQPFPLPKLNLSGINLPPALKSSIWKKIKADFTLIYKENEPEIMASADGTILYLSAKFTKAWTPEQVVLYVLSQKGAFLDQLHAKDPAVFDAFETLLKTISTTQINVTFTKMHLLPTFTKQMIVWKIPLLTSDIAKQAQDVIIKELLHV